MAGDSTTTNLLYAAVELGIADLLGDGPRSGVELAAASGAQADALQRVLRGRALIGVVSPHDGGRHTLTPLGACLRRDAPDSLRSFVRLVGHPVIQRAWSELLHTVITGEPALDRAVGMEGFAYMMQSPELSAIFNEAMAGITAKVAAAVVEAYDFVGVNTIVDVGGGDGTLPRAILRAHPGSTGTILDMPHVQEQAETAIAADGLTGRCRFQSGDFFSGVPAGADAYLLKPILHDWDDERCVTILRACRRAMNAAARLLIVTGLLDSPHTPMPDAVIGDLIMLTMGSGRERTESEHAALLTAAGLQLTRVVPTGSGSVILEALSCY